MQIRASYPSLQPLSNANVVAVGTGDGSTLAFDLTSVGIRGCAVFVAGIIQASTAWSLSAATGAGGVDQLVFGSGNAPGAGAAIEVIAYT